MWVLWSVRLKLAECRGGWVPLGENSIRPSPESTAISQSIINIPTTLFGILTGSKCISEKAMAPHSSTLAWKIPWTEEPGGLQSIGSRRVGHDWATSLSLFTFVHWRRKWQPTPVFLPGESQGRRSLVGCHLWGHTESDTTEAISSSSSSSSSIYMSISIS